MLRAVNLYGNVGGVSLAMDNVGFDVPATICYDDGFAKTSHKNLEHHTEHVDFSEKRPSDVAVDFSNTDWVHGSPPCRGLTGANGERSFDDKRNREMRKYISWVGEIEPPIATLEMVPTVTYDYEEGRFIDRVFDWWEEEGYEMRWEMHDARNYGTASRRKRCLMVAIRDDIDYDLWDWPEPTHSPPDADDDLKDWRTKGEAIHDLPHVEPGDTQEDVDVPNHVPVDHDDHVIERLGNLDHGSNGWGAGSNRAPCDEPAYTLECREPVHCCDSRSLTIREMARLMGFPDDHVFVGNKPGKLGVGTTIPIRMGKAIAESVGNFLDCY